MSWQSSVVECLEPKLQAMKAIDGFHWVAGAQTSTPGGEANWGTAATKSEAATKALAELVERISVCDSSRFQLEHATAEELNESEWLLWPSPNGRLGSSLSEVDPSFSYKKMYWIEGNELTVEGGEFKIGQRRFVPAHLVFVRWTTSEPWQFRKPTSAGAAVHNDKQTALKNAYDELLEHHIKMLHFFAGRNGDEFDVPINGYLRDSCEAFHRHNVIPYFFQMTIPQEINVYIAYLESSNVPRLTAGTGETPEKALAEALQGRAILESYFQKQDWIVDCYTQGELQGRAVLESYFQSHGYEFCGDEYDREGSSLFRDQITNQQIRSLHWACSEQQTPRQSMQSGSLSEKELSPRHRGPHFVVDLTEGLASELGLYAVKVVEPSSLMGFGSERDYHDWIPLAQNYLNECTYPVPHPFW